MSNAIIQTNYGEYQKLIDDSLKELENKNIIQRVWKKDYTVWSDNPAEISNRLDWLESPEDTLSKLSEIKDFVENVKANRFTNILLLGMGGSSLAPEVFSLTFGVKNGFMNLSVLDSTDPVAVLNFTKKLDPAKTLYIVSTKSGGTIETLSFFKYFFTYCKNKLGKYANKHFIAITDPGSGLEKMAKDLDIRKIFLNNPNIGGRYSVLSLFGMVPASLIGIDLERFLNNALAIANECKNAKNISSEIGVAMAQLAKLGRDKLTFVYSNKIASFGTWVEQLIAESTGKKGIGIIPIESEELLSPIFYMNDRVFVYTHLMDDNANSEKINLLKNAGHPVIEITLNDEYDLGGEFFRWEFATAVAGWNLGIQPFDQPNVESAKIEAKAMINSYIQNGELPKLKANLVKNGIKIYYDKNISSIKEALNDFLSNLIDSEKFNYVAIQAYITPNIKTTETLQNLRTVIQKKYKSAVTVGYGPRFLHSTGQLHKGDAGKGLFIQFTSNRKEDAEIPKEISMNTSEFSFGVLINAQLMGDRQALLNNNRKVITIDLGDEVENNLIKIIEMIIN